MPKTTDKVASMAGTAKPYVDRALHDEELRDHVKQAYAAARDDLRRADRPARRRLRGAARGRRPGNPGQPPRRRRPSCARRRPGCRGSAGEASAARVPAADRRRGRPALQPVHRPGDAPLAEGQAVRRLGRVRLRRPAPVRERRNRRARGPRSSTRRRSSTGSGVGSSPIELPPALDGDGRAHRPAERPGIEAARGRDVARLEQDRAGGRRAARCAGLRGA